MHLTLGTVESSPSIQPTTTKSTFFGKTVVQQEKAVLIKDPLAQIGIKTFKILAKPLSVAKGLLRPTPSSRPPQKQQQLAKVAECTSAAAADCESQTLEESTPVESKAVAVGQRPDRTVSVAAHYSSFTAPAKSSPSAAIRCPARCSNKMEHSYVRDCARPKYELITGLSAARTILVARPPQCPYCHPAPVEENELDDGNQVPVPTFNEIAAKEAMCECSRIAKYVKNTNPENEDWESRINQDCWTSMQKSIFAKVARILDNDQLGRLANMGRQNEVMQRRIVVDKSAKRMRKALASISWDARLTQWLHCLLMDCLPASYMASYLDILQTLKSKLPTLMDKMLFGRPMNVSQELLAPVMKKKWEPIVTSTKSRKLSQNAVIVALPSMPTTGPITSRMQKWYQHLASITQVVQVSLPMTGSSISRQPLDQVAEQIVSLTRVKIQEMHNEYPGRCIILIGFNAGSALALQVAMSENVNCVVCMGFAFNTMNGVRGTPDDRLLDIKTPILFVIGQNSARTSPEEVESLREKMQSDSSLVVVGSADDVLRIPKSRRIIENVTQSMVDSMIVDEVFEFTKKVLSNPPGPRIPTSVTVGTGYAKQNKTSANETVRAAAGPRKRKMDGDDSGMPAKTKYTSNMGRPRTRNIYVGNTGLTQTNAGKAALMVTSMPGAASKLSPPPAIGQQKSRLSPNSISNEDLNLAIQSILSDSNEQEPPLMTANDPKKMVTNFELVPQQRSKPMKTVITPLKQSLSAGGTAPIGTKIKMIPANQFVQIKPPIQSQSKIYTIKPSSLLNNSSCGAASGTSTGIGTIVNTSPANISSGQQQIFTLKSPNGQTTQFVTAAAPAPQKYSVVKPAPTASAGDGNLDLSNIIDMPIIFADSDGNISDPVSAGASTEGTKSQATPPRTSNSSVGQLIISQQIIKEANNSGSPASNSGSNSAPGNTIIFNNNPITNVTTTTKPNKVVFINRNTMKPCPNIISRSNVAHLPKYAKVVVTNSKTSGTTVVPRTTPQPTVSSVVPSVKHLNVQGLKAPVNNGSSSTTGGVQIQKQIQILNKASGSPNNVVITEKPQIRNIVLKPGGLKQIPPHLKTQLLNRNISVHKLVNIVPAGKATITPTTNSGTTIGGTSIAVSQRNASGSSPPNTSVGTTASNSIANSIQTAPKIITLNPINPTATTPTHSKASSSSD